MSGHSAVGRGMARRHAVAQGRRSLPMLFNTNLPLGSLAVLRRRFLVDSLFSDGGPIPDAKQLLVSAHGYVMTRKGLPPVGIL